jgi:hypothetical protein
MLLPAQSIRSAKGAAVCFAIGLMMIAWPAIVHMSAARAESLVVRVDIPLTGILNITILGDEDTQTPSNVIDFGNITTSDTALFEHNSASSDSDLRITVQTNCTEWHLTQHIGQDLLMNASGNTIDLYWKTSDQSSYGIVNSQQNADLLASSGASSGYSIDLDYALDAPVSTPPGEYSGIVTYTLSYN